MYSMRGYDGLLQESHRALLNPIDHNIVFKSRLGDVFGAMDKVQAHDEDTLGSGSGSGVSNLSELENETTDDFGRRLLQHHRDEQRVSNVVRGNGQLFRKARPRPRIAEAILREERERENQSPDHQRVGSSGSNESDPPVTIPREWGRKARRQRDWMKKIVEPEVGVDENVTLERIDRDEDAILPHRTAYTGDVGWRIGEDDDPGTPPSMRRRERHSLAATPSSLRHMNTTLRPSASPEDGDFTAASLLASTPAATRLPRKIDELTRREIEDIERQGVTTRALDEIDLRSPNGTLRRTSSSRLRERASADAMASSPPRSPRPLTAPANGASPSRIPRRRRSPASDKENVPLNGEAKGSHPPKMGEAMGGETRPEQAVNIKNSPRARHHRNDSMNLLRKLARVSSMSPSPAQEKADVDEVEKRGTARGSGDANPSAARKYDGEDVADSTPPKNERKSSGWGLGFEALLAGRSNDDISSNQKPTLKPEYSTDKAAAPEEDAANGKTPIITGAWVDSSLPNGTALTANGSKPVEKSNSGSSGKTGTAEEAQELEDDLRKVRSEPPHAKSALEAIMHETRNQQNDLQFGESTIQSLEDIVHPNIELTDPTITFEFDAAAAAAAQENLDNGEPLSQAQKDRRQEDLAMEGLNKHLRAARTSIKDASRGLRRVENRIEAAQEGELPTSTIKTPTTIIVRKPADSNGFTHCEVCGGGYHSVWYALWAEFRSMFYSWDSTSRFGISFTWLGAWCLGWFLWYMAESTMCSFYCKPQYAVPGTRHPPAAYDTPRFPFTIPMVLFKPWYSYWGPTFDAFTDALEAYLHELTHELPLEGPPPHPPTYTRPLTTTLPVSREWMAAATATSVRVAQSILDAVDEVGSMWDDEFM